MNPSTMLAECAKAGVVLSLNPQGGIQAAGDRGAVAKLLPTIKAHKPELLAALAGKAQQATQQPESLLDECKRLTVEVIGGNDAFPWQGRTLDADGARLYAFKRFETATREDLEDFIQWARDFLEGRAKP